MKAVILAGGIGTRMWPMSRKALPKQFSKLVSERVLIRDTYERLRPQFAVDDIYVSISPSLVPLLKEEFPELKDDHILIEPEKRDTGPAMGYVAALMELEAPDEPMVFVPSDHHIQDNELFLENLKVGGALIRETGKLIDIGVTPTFPSTVLGYTRVGQEVERRGNVPVMTFAGHTEKPNYDVAKQYLEEGSYLWHANYYMWTPALFMAALEKYAPELGGTLRQIQTAFQSGDVTRTAELYASLEKISIDYAMTEKMDPEDLLILLGEFGWSDVGAWDTLHENLREHDEENIVRGEALCVETKRSLVYSTDKRLVTVLGMDGVVVVDTPDALLVCDIDRAQDVKKLIAQLDEQGHSHLL